MIKATLAVPDLLLPAPFGTLTFAKLLADEPAPIVFELFVGGDGAVVSSKLNVDMLAGKPEEPFVADKAGEERTEEVSDAREEEASSAGPS